MFLLFPATVYEVTWFCVCVCVFIPAFDSGIDFEMFDARTVQTRLNLNLICSYDQQHQRSQHQQQHHSRVAHHPNRHSPSSFSSSCCLYFVLMIFITIISLCRVKYQTRCTCVMKMDVCRVGSLQPNPTRTCCPSGLPDFLTISVSLDSQHKTLVFLALVLLPPIWDLNLSKHFV